MTVLLRSRPEDTPQPVDMPQIDPQLVLFCHPHNGKPFLPLVAYDTSDCNLQVAPPIFGIHHGTALLACEILACNAKGYLSTSWNPSDQGARTAASPDELLTASRYYYHLNFLPPDGNPFYPLCLDFDLWGYPGSPGSWKPQSVANSELMETHSDWTATSLVIKLRDHSRCRISNWPDGIQTAHIVPREHEPWMFANDMYSHLSRVDFPLTHHSDNLFALRADLHSSFDSAIFAIVPKNGQMVVHFLRRSHYSANMYHNTPFDNVSLSNDLLFARFAWAVIKVAATTVITTHAQKQWRLVKCVERAEEVTEGEDGEGKEEEEKAGGKRKRRKVGNDEGGSKGKTAGRGRRAASGHAHTILPEADQPDSQDEGEAVDLDARELARDMAVAQRAHPYFLDSDGQADGWTYENLPWYPGHSAIERKKREYLATHPNIRAHSKGTAASSEDMFTTKPSQAT